MNLQQALLALRNRALGATGFPAGRAWENVSYDPTAGVPYIVESFVPAPADLFTFPANGGSVEQTGLYILQYFGITGTGFSGISTPVNAILARFAPGQGLGTLADGSTLRVRTNPGPWASAVTRIEGGWSFVTITVPWAARSTNVLV